MNIRKPVDYSAMYADLYSLMAADLPQMELYCGIGRAISEMPEKRGRCDRRRVFAGQASRHFRLLSPEHAPDAGVLPHLRE